MEKESLEDLKNALDRALEGNKWLRAELDYHEGYARESNAAHRCAICGVWRWEDHPGELREARDEDGEGVETMVCSDACELQALNEHAEGKALAASDEYDYLTRHD